MRSYPMIAHVQSETYQVQEWQKDFVRKIDKTQKISIESLAWYLASKMIILAA